ncbi:MAG: long-chain fatty acid--CoA ligase [bacterium]|nr:long-chain fatty acid--CoA ligase [bacterium]
MGTRTLNDIFFHATRDLCSERAFQRKIAGTYESISAAKFETMAFELGLGLRKLGLVHGDRVAILSLNRLEWAAADYGILLNGGVNVPIYQTLLAEQILYILENSGTRFIFTSDPLQTAKIIAVRDRLPKLEKIIQFEGAIDREDVISLVDLATAGRENITADSISLEEAARSVEPDDTCSIIYTSGTTGQPKGVVLTHGNIVSIVVPGLRRFHVDTRDSVLSFLPLSHIFERTVGYYVMLQAGASIAYAESIDTVPQNLQEVRPTIMVAVPRLYEKMYARILDAALAGGFIKKNLFFWAKRVGERWAEMTLAGKPIPRPLAHMYKFCAKVVFSKVKERTGGHLRYFISGGAPLAVDIARFFYAAGLPIYEGYGLTETSPVITANNEVDGLRLGTVGKTLDNIEVKIAEDGEILTRGPNVMREYYANEQATREVLDDEGWLATGDIGELSKDGWLKITDRKKDIIVTAGGKNIAPQSIENLFKTDKFISECLVIGDRQPFISALIVPNFEYVVKYAVRHNIIYTSMIGLLKEPQLIDLYRRRVEKHNARLARFEQVKKFRIIDHELTQEDGHLTPSLKVKRKVVLKMKADLVADIYPEDTSTR